MDLLYFIILISSLIFVHELGHFTLAKLFGVRVLTFSLGFGPKVLRLRGRETEYCVSLIPLGGYVRMLEASKSEFVLPEDADRTFESLPLYKRILIVLAGPVMNLTFPVLLYFSTFVGEEPFLPPTVGQVIAGKPAEGKLFPGDRIMEVDGQTVGTFDEVRRLVAQHPNEPLVFKVFREHRHVDVEITPRPMQSSGAVQAAGRSVVELSPTQPAGIGILSSAPSAVVGVPGADSPAYRAGLRTFDVVTRVAGGEVRRFMDLEAELLKNRGSTVPITYLRPVKVESALGGYADMAVFEAGVVALTPSGKGESLLGRTGLELADLYLAVVPEDTSFYRAGLRPTDKLLRVDGLEVSSWRHLREQMLNQPEREYQLEYLAAADGQVRQVAVRVPSGELNRVRNFVPLAPEEWVEHPAPLRYAMRKAVEATVGVTLFVLDGMYRFAQGRLSMDTLSGPMAIYELTGQERKKGTANFVWVMALISINLGLLNLLPIPVLDGGHLMFFGLEAAIRRPLPLRAKEIAHLVGMAIVLVLIAVALKNDLEKFGIL